MLSSNPSLNPAIRNAAELFTDGRMSDAVVLGVAARLGMPLMVPAAAPAAPDTLALARQEMAAAEAALRIATAAFDAARAQLGQANRRFAPPLYKGLPRRSISDAARRRAQSRAMSFLNTRRGMMRRAAKRLQAAHSALLTCPVTS